MFGHIYNQYLSYIVGEPDYKSESVLICGRCYKRKIITP